MRVLATVELIDAVRRCAAEKLSMAETARQLTSRRHRLTRSVVSGIARRNSIAFSSLPKFWPRRGVHSVPLPSLLASVPAPLPYVEIAAKAGRRYVVMYRFYGYNVWRVRLKRGWRAVSSVLVPGRVIGAAAAKCTGVP